MGDLEPERRGVKMLAPDERILLVGELVVALQRADVGRGGQHGGV